MLRTLFAFLIAIAATSVAASAPRAPSIDGKAWMLLDLSSGQPLLAEKAEERFEPASLTKLMTAYLTFSALRDKKISLTPPVRVSERAWKAPGSRMFIQPGKPVLIEDLILGMVVQSGNDACIALAEAIAGSEEIFAQMMNREAERLGMRNSNFTNASGLPDARHYSTANDLALLASALIRDFPVEYERFYSQREFRYNNITQLNRNRLLWLDPSVDGVKTGYTEGAGYCLIASARHGPRRLLSVLLGSSSEASRAQESLKLLNWGFQFFDSVKLYDQGQQVKTIEVWKGRAESVKAGFRDALVVTVPKGEAEKLKAELLSQQPLLAPVRAGQTVGVLRVTLEGRPVGEFPLVALEPVGVAGLFGRAWDTLRLWLK